MNYLIINYFVVTIMKKTPLRQCHTQFDSLTLFMLANKGIEEKEKLERGLPLSHIVVHRVISSASITHFEIM